MRDSDQLTLVAARLQVNASAVIATRKTEVEPPKRKPKKKRAVKKR